MGKGLSRPLIPFVTSQQPLEVNLAGCPGLAVETWGGLGSMNGTVRFLGEGYFPRSKRPGLGCCRRGSRIAGSDPQV
jgi:hypothetical protein